MNETKKLIENNNTTDIKQYSPDVWKKISEFVVKELEEYLGVNILAKNEKEDYDYGFYLDITPKKRALSICQLAWKGIAVSTTQEDGISISASLFFYLNGKKVITKDGESFIELVYNSSTGFKWMNEGWLNDEYDEFDYFDEY